MALGIQNGRSKRPEDVIIINDQDFGHCGSFRVSEFARDLGKWQKL
jgi:hypothetical protein